MYSKIPEKQLPVLFLNPPPKMKSQLRARLPLLLWRGQRNFRSRTGRRDFLLDTARAPYVRRPWTRTTRDNTMRGKHVQFVAAATSGINR